MLTMPNRRVTLGDVARAAGVSVSTASEALSGRGRMTSDTRAAVHEAARRLGYRPNALARGLRTGRTHTIGLHRMHAADNFDSEYFRELVAGVMDVTTCHDYDLSLLSSNPGRRRAAAPRVDGIIIVDPIADDLRAAELVNSGLPVIAGERYPPGMPSSPVIGVDHSAALARLLEHGLAAGARRPALFAPDEKSGWGVVLREAFGTWCRQQGIRGTHRSVAFQGRRFREDDGAFLLAALTGDDPADFVIVPGEHAALAAINVISAAGRSPGADVLIAACADAHLLSVCEPSVTAVELFPRRLGTACAEALIACLDSGSELPPETLLPAELHPRKSTASLTTVSGR
jgi:DNA-binding LacI/PurR family transcriptional regulator